ncbi:MAG: helix-turn-helix domain-containing protein [Candidatus Moranbacteria bacterium]|nr:helix-turn-helix domain-containing protein [Candidatus Moranbacteria bacterium]
MEKDFAQLNYYEMLDIKPDATALEIRGAYNAALQMYHPDSLVSYSFFSQKERKKILALLEMAYFTLINEKERDIYDNELIRTGIFSADEKTPAIKKSVNIFDINRQKDASGILKSGMAELKAKISQNQRIREILSRQEISGADLKEIRNELDVAIEKIHQETKISLNNLNWIEDDKTEKLPAAVFLKGFIKAYLKCLCLDPVDDISNKYMSTLTRVEKK